MGLNLIQGYSLAYHVEFLLYLSRIPQMSADVIKYSHIILKQNLFHLVIDCMK